MTKITKIKSKRGGIKMSSVEIKRMLSDYDEQLYVDKLDNLEEMAKFL